MNDKTQAVFNGYLNLSQQEKNDLLTEIGKERDRRRRGIVESNTVSLGPIQGGCPCCGR